MSYGGIEPGKGDDGHETAEGLPVEDDENDEATDPKITETPETPAEKQRRFLDESRRRFGRLDCYVDQKLEEKERFPIRGNLRVAQYVRDYLEFLVKKHLIYDFLSPAERELIFGDKNNPVDASNGRQYWNSVVDYFRDPSATLTSMNEVSYTGSAADDIPSAEDIQKRVVELAQRMEIEQGLEDIKRKIGREHAGFFNRIPRIRLLDAGPAIGAISAMLVLEVLDEYGLLSKTEVTLWDVSQRVLDKNVAGTFNIKNEEFMTDAFRSRDYYRMLKQALTYNVRAVCGPIEDGLPSSEIGEFDIVLACFLIHHVSNEYKQAVANVLRSVTKGALFVADETPAVYDEHGFAEQHSGDEVPLAPEEPIELDASKALFVGMPERETTHTTMGNLWYAYWMLGGASSDGYGRYFELLPQPEEYLSMADPE